MEGYISSIIFLVRGSSFAYAINALPINVCRRILLQRRSSWPVERAQEMILLDIAMPEMDGIETFERMKKEFDIKIPVIFLTASGYEDDVRTAIELGAVNYLKKPFFPQELLKRVAKEFEKE